MIILGLHTGCIGSVFITGSFGNFYTKRGEFLTFRTGIPGGLGSMYANSFKNHIFRGSQVVAIDTGNGWQDADAMTSLPS